MTISIRTITRTKKAAYWLATGFTAIAYIVIGAADLLHAPMMMASLARLGYPAYLATILGVWKLLGAVAITAPGFPRLKEWAYAGMFFNLTGAALSHAASGDPPKDILVPLGLLVVVLISMGLRSETVERALFSFLNPPQKNRPRVPARADYRAIVKLILFAILAIGWTHSAMAQAQGPPSGDQSQSAAELGKQAANPLSAGWLLQTQQNSNWVEMPANGGERIQSDLLFQPLINARLTEDWTVFVRPVVTLFNSTPVVNPNQSEGRRTGFGDSVLAFAFAPRPFFNGRLTLAAGPTFVFPTASDHLLGQHTWQLGPDVGVVLSGKHFIAYAFPQQWFKIGGGGAKTNQLNTNSAFSYFFNNGWSVGTQPNLTVDWEAPGNQRVTLPIGPQVGKLCTCGGTPTLVQLQVQYYAVRPSVGPKWGVQLQITPTIPALIKRALF